MHELSLSHAAVETVLESITNLKVARVKRVTAIIGELSGISLDAFRFAFPIAAADTLLEGCELLIQLEPVTVYCPKCNETVTLKSITSFRCPVCQTLTGDLRSGKQFSIYSIDVELDAEPINEYAHS